MVHLFVLNEAKDEHHFLFAFNTKTSKMFCLPPVTKKQLNLNVVILQSN